MASSLAADVVPTVARWRGRRRSPAFMDAVRNHLDVCPDLSFFGAVCEVERRWPDIAADLARRQADEHHRAALLACWNAWYPAGTIVGLRHVVDGPEEIVTRTSSAAWMLCGTPVVGVEHRRGPWALTHLRPLSWRPS